MVITINFTLCLASEYKILMDGNTNPVTAILEYTASTASNLGLIKDNGESVSYSYADTLTAETPYYVSITGRDNKQQEGYVFVDIKTMIYS